MHLNPPIFSEVGLKEAYSERLAQTSTQGPLDLDAELAYLRQLWRIGSREQRWDIEAVATWLKDQLSVDAEIEWLNPTHSWFT